MILALAGGFHRAGQFELALPLAREAAAKLDSPAAHLNLGDLLLAVAEGQSDVGFGPQDLRAGRRGV